MTENFHNIYAWLFMLACFPQGLVTGWFFTKCFDIKIHKFAAVFIFGILSFLFVIPQTFFEFYVPYKPYIIYSMLMLAILLLKSKNTSNIKAVVWLAIDIFVDMALELLIMMLCILIGFIDFEKGTDFYDFNRVAATLIFTTASIPAKYIMSVLWNKIITKDSNTRFNPSVVLFPVAQFLCVVAITVEHSSIGYFDISDVTFGMNTSTILIFTMFMFAFADIIYLYFISDLEKKYKIENELKLTRYQHELEAKHYQDIIDKQYEVAKIRHDINNQLLAVKSMISSGEINSANEIIQQLSDDIRNTDTNKYSSSPVINALLTEKADFAQEKEIVFKTNIIIPENSKITSTHLCSIFSNLIDNAIKANMKVKNPEERYISVISTVKNDNLLIQLKNPISKSDSESKRLYRKKGYGLKILKDIADEYSGNFTAKISDDIFECNMIIDYTKSPKV